MRLIKMHTRIKADTVLTAVGAPKYIVQSALTALSDGKISEAVDQFDDQFTFNDQALGVEFTDKQRLREFFQKSRELFPDTVVKVISTFECGDHVIAEWELTATETVSHLRVRWEAYRFALSPTSGLEWIAVLEFQAGDTSSVCTGT